ncbi:MAG: FecR domain-containing protein [Aestuariivirga sp.]
MRPFFFALTATAVLSATASQSTALAADAIGKVAAVLGKPSASGPGGDRDLKAGAAVYEDDKIEVRSGNAQIILADGTRLVVGPGSTLVLDRFLMTGGNTAEKVSIKALRGTFRFITGRSAKSAYDIQTANATIGIRGTGFDFWTQKQTGVAVLEGKVKLCRDDKCVDLHEGCELGRTTSDETDKLEGRLKGRLIVNYLPYILNQGSLRTAFRLPIQDCNSSLPREREGGGNQKDINNKSRD